MSRIPETTEASTARRDAILGAAIGVFSRYGLKKTSMDDVARAAGLSRQGLYLHFATKDALFRAVVLHVVEKTRAAGEAALARDTDDVEARLLGAFEAMHASLIAHSAPEHIAELFEAAEALVGPVLAENEEATRASIAKVLRASGVAARWKDAGVSAKELASLLDAASQGIKHSVGSVAEYRERMASAVRVVCRGRA